MTRRACFIVLLVAVAPLFAGPAKRAYVDSDAYELYASIIPSTFLWKNAGPESTLVIRADTAPHQACTDRGSNAADAQVASVITSYRAANRKPHKLAQLFQLTRPYEFASFTDLKAWSLGKDKERHRRFLASHPDFRGWIEFSAVGFNPEKTIAAVSFSFFCSGGGGAFELFQKVKGEWKPLIVRGVGCFWQS